MPSTERRGARSAQAPASAARGPVWRALLEARWRARLQEVTELSLAYHEAAAAAPGGPGGRAGDRRLRQLLRRAVAARRALADTDEALGRLAAGCYGLCEGCAAAIPARLLAVVPEARYCLRCLPAPAAPGRARDGRRPGARPLRRHARGHRLTARSSRSSVLAMLVAQILPLSMPMRSPSGAREQS